jgi:hypothetical protein
MTTGVKIELTMVIESTIIYEVLESIGTLFAQQIGGYVKDFQYSPMDPPKKRRVIMASMRVPLATLLKFFVIVIMKGASPARYLKGMKESAKMDAKAVMNTMKVKNLCEGNGNHTAFQWMTSWWDVGFTLCTVNRDLTIKMFYIGEKYEYTRMLPIPCYIPGGLHIFRGVENAIQNQLINEMFRYQHFCIYCKNLLGGRKNEDKPEYQTKRDNQVKYFKLQMADDDINNFTAAEVDIVQKVNEFDTVDILRKAVFSKLDYIKEPYKNPMDDFCIDVEKMVGDNRQQARMYQAPPVVIPAQVAPNVPPVVGPNNPPVDG